MSIFSSLRRSRQQAKEHSAKVAEQKRKEENRVPYRHVPTHAASDAIACAPPSWREQTDRPKILEQNRRRSAMAAAGFSMNVPGIPRVGSSLSYVSYPVGDATPVVRIPRPQSYSSMYPYHGRGDVIYSLPDASHSEASSWKGKEVARPYGDETPRISPTPSKEGRTMDNSSTSSQDEQLEMKPARAAESTAVHRLHPSHSRRPSDASERQPAAAVRSTSRDSRPPPSTRGFASIPPAAASNVYLSPSSSGPTNAGSSTPRSSSSKRNSFTTSTPVILPNAEAPLQPVAIPNADFDFSAPQDGAAMTAPVVSARMGRIGNKDRNQSRSSRIYDLEPIESMSTGSGYLGQERVYAGEMPPPVHPEDLANVFPESTQYKPDTRPAKATKRLSKSGGAKLSKKNRWSLSRRAEVTV